MISGEDEVVEQVHVVHEVLELIAVDLKAVEARRPLQVHAATIAVSTPVIRRAVASEARRHYETVSTQIKSKNELSMYNRDHEVFQ